MEEDIPLWIFGYGSLVWRPAFPHPESCPAWIRGWVRRFWQGSTDHRGVPGAPGRVVTLVPAAADAVCWGRAFRVEASARASVLDALDYREKGGYRREMVMLYRGDGSMLGEGLVYRATPDNPNYLGPASLEVLVEQVRCSHGPSGPNTEYVLCLDAALAELGVVDLHVRELADRLRAVSG